MLDNLSAHKPVAIGEVIEIANGRLRMDLPRKTKLKNYTDKDIQDLALMYNNTPRKCLGYQTPNQRPLHN